MQHVFDGCKMGTELKEAATQRGNLEEPQAVKGSALRMNAGLQAAGDKDSPADSESDQEDSEQSDEL